MLAVGKRILNIELKKKKEEFEKVFIFSDQFNRKNKKSQKFKIFSGKIESKSLIIKI